MACSSEQMRGDGPFSLGCTTSVESRPRWQCPCGREVSSTGELHHHIQDEKPTCEGGLFVSVPLFSECWPMGRRRGRSSSPVSPTPGLPAWHSSSVWRRRALRPGAPSNKPPGTGTGRIDSQVVVATYHWNGRRSPVYRVPGLPAKIDADQSAMDLVGDLWLQPAAGRRTHDIPWFQATRPPSRPEPPTLPEAEAPLMVAVLKPTSPPI